MVYLPSIKGEFLFDDVITLTQNPLIHHPSGLRYIWFSTEPLDYFPLTLSSFWIEWRLWGGNPAGFHWVNILLHAASALMLWRVLLRLGIPGAWMAAAVFAVHPLNTSSVAWITERKNTMSRFFFHLSVLFYLKAEKPSAPGKDTSTRRYWLSVGAFLLALLSKTSVVMLPVVLLGLAWWRNGRVTFRDIQRTIPFFALSLVLGLVTVWFQFHRASGGESSAVLSLGERLAGAGMVPWFYLFKTLLPTRLSMFYPEWKIDPASLAAYLPGIVLLGLCVVFWRYRAAWGRHLLLATGYFVLMLFPVLGFFDMFFFMYSRVADHWAYLAVIGLIIPLFAGPVHGLNRMEARYKAEAPARSSVPARTRFMGGAQLASAAVLGVLAMLTWKQSGAFANEETLWRDTLAKNPRAWAAHINLGIALENRGQLEQAAQQYLAAVRLKPDFYKAHYNLGIVRTQQGMIDEAMKHYREAFGIRPKDIESRNNYAILLANQGRTEEAIAEYRAALEQAPNFYTCHYNLSLALANAGRKDEAIAHLKEALRIRPDYVEARDFLEQLTQ